MDGGIICLIFLCVLLSFARWGSQAARKQMCFAKTALWTSAGLSVSVTMQLLFMLCIKLDKDAVKQSSKKLSSLTLHMF